MNPTLWPLFHSYSYSYSIFISSVHTSALWCLFLCFPPSLPVLAVWTRPSGNPSSLEKVITGVEDVPASLPKNLVLGQFYSCLFLCLTNQFRYGPWTASHAVSGWVWLVRGQSQGLLQSLWEGCCDGLAASSMNLAARNRPFGLCIHCSKLPLKYLENKNLSLRILYPLHAWGGCDLLARAQTIFVDWCPKRCH